MADIHTIPAVKKAEPGLWRMLLALLTDPGCRKAFKDGWNRVKLEQEAKAAEEVKNIRLQKAEETTDKSDYDDYSDGRIRSLVPNAMLKGTVDGNPYVNPEMIYDPYGFTEL